MYITNQCMINIYYYYHFLLLVQLSRTSDNPATWPTFALTASPPWRQPNPMNLPPARWPGTRTRLRIPPPHRHRHHRRHRTVVRCHRRRHTLLPSHSRPITGSWLVWWRQKPVPNWNQKMVRFFLIIMIILIHLNNKTFLQSLDSFHIFQKSSPKQSKLVFIRAVYLSKIL